MTLPKITNKQQEILCLLYRYRYLDRIQIQRLLHHKDKKHSISWLKDLREKQYVEWIYDGDNFAEKIKPAVYYLGLNGIRYLRELGTFPASELRKRYKEPTRKQPFIDRCMLIADCCIRLGENSVGGVNYEYATEADYSALGSRLSFLGSLRPHLFFAKHDGKETRNYLLEVFDATLPRYQARKRIKDYVEYLSGGDWEDETGDNEPPVALIVCPTTADLIYAKRRVRIELENEGDEMVHVRFATAEKLKSEGLTSRIWEEA